MLNTLNEKCRVTQLLYSPVYEFTLKDIAVVEELHLSFFKKVTNLEAEIFNSASLYLHPYTTTTIVPKELPWVSIVCLGESKNLLLEFENNTNRILLDKNKAVMYPARLSANIICDSIQGTVQVIYLNHLLRKDESVEHEFSDEVAK